MPRFLALGRLRQEGCYELEASVGYTEGSRPPRLRNGPLSQTTKQTKIFSKTIVQKPYVTVILSYFLLSSKSVQSSLACAKHFRPGSWFGGTSLGTVSFFCLTNIKFLLIHTRMTLQQTVFSNSEHSI